MLIHWLHVPFFFGITLFRSIHSADLFSLCSLRSRSKISFWPTASSPDCIPEWYTRRRESTSSIDWVRTSASSFIFAVASLIYTRVIEHWRTPANKLSLTSSSVNWRPSCSTRDLTAFHPVRRCLKEHLNAEWKSDDGIDIPNGHIASQSKVFRLENFVRARVVEDSLGMDTCLVGESAVTTVEHAKFWVKQ